MRNLTPLAERLTRRSRPDESGCTIWTGRTNNAGYGSITISGKSRLVHRVAYEAAVDVIPDGMTIDHLCRNKVCINPGHMEVVTRAENVRRRDGASADECRNGHLYTPENTRLRGDARGVRICRACERAAGERYRNKLATRHAEAGAA